MSVPAPPKGTGPAGRRLWRAVLADWELQPHEQTLLLQAVATADLCNDLAAVVAAEGLLVRSPEGAQRAHPALVELRQQRVLLARLLVALRVPLGDEDGQAGTSAARPQRRGLRGIYAVRGGVA